MLGGHGLALTILATFGTSGLPSFPLRIHRNVRKEETNEHLGHLIRGAANSLAWGLYCVSRGGRTDPLVTRTRSNLSNPAFCDG
jgi:hypothetical protein